MKIKIGDALTYRDPQVSTRYGTGVVTAITSDEYVVLWSGRGATRYRRSILDERIERIFKRQEDLAGVPRQRQLSLGAAKAAKVPLNENYDRGKVASLCEKLKKSGARKAQDVANGISAEMFTKRFALRGEARAVLYQLAELCSTRSSSVCDHAKDISRELFFGYVIRKSDFTEL